MPQLENVVHGQSLVFCIGWHMATKTKPRKQPSTDETAILTINTFTLALTIFWLVTTGEPPATRGQAPTAAELETSLLAAPSIETAEHETSPPAAPSIAAAQEAPATEAANPETSPPAAPPTTAEPETSP